MNELRDNKGRFQKAYINSDIDVRDRFMVAFNKEERDMFTDMQLWIGQSEDGTALKQWAFYGWLTIVSNDQSMAYLKEKLFINDRNNRRLGLNVKSELENNFQQKLMKNGGPE